MDKFEFFLAVAIGSFLANVVDNILVLGGVPLTFGAHEMLAPTLGLVAASIALWVVSKEKSAKV